MHSKIPYGLFNKTMQEHFRSTYSLILFFLVHFLFPMYRRRCDRPFLAIGVKWQGSLMRLRILSNFDLKSLDNT